MYISLADVKSIGLNIFYQKITRKHFRGKKTNKELVTLCLQKNSSVLFNRSGQKRFRSGARRTQTNAQGRYANGFAGRGRDGWRYCLAGIEQELVSTS